MGTLAPLKSRSQDAHRAAPHHDDPHARADRLLAEAEACTDRDRARALRQQAVVLTLDLADRIARRYAGRGLDLEDLVQVGRMALVKAANGYRTGCGHGFAAYAGPTIAGEIKRHFRDCGWAVRPPRRLQEVRADLASEQERLTHDLHRDPTIAELAEALGVQPDEVVRARECSAAYRAVSIDLPADHDSHPVEVVARESHDIDRMLRLDSVLHALHALTERERRIVHLRFVEDRTQSEIGEVLGVSQMQVSRLLSAILGKLRHGLGEDERAA
jgi:RNA polymerase sigma-B factor